MIGTWCTRFAAVLLAGVFVAGSAHAAGKDKIFEACAERMKEEFGEAEFNFSNIRRSENRNFAFGEMTLEDGSKQRVRCSFRRGQVRDMRFRSGSQDVGNRWTNERPPGAVYVPLQDEAEDPATVDDGEATDDQAQGDATQTTAAQDGAAAEGQTPEDPPADTAEAGDTPESEEKDLVRPRFIKAPTY